MDLIGPFISWILFYVCKITNPNLTVAFDYKWCFQLCMLKVLIVDDVGDRPLGGVASRTIGVSDNVTKKCIQWGTEGVSWYNSQV